MKLFSSKVLLATLGFMLLNAGKATLAGYPVPMDSMELAVYLPTLFVLSLVYAWVFKYVWLKMDEHFEGTEGEEYVGREWE